MTTKTTNKKTNNQKMTLEEVAASLWKYLDQKIDAQNSVQVIGIKKKRLTVYTVEKPTVYERDIKEHMGIKVKWKKIGKIVNSPA